MLTGTSWLGGALGDQPTLVTEPAFSAQAGLQANAVYTAPIGGETGQAVRVSGVRDFTRVAAGDHWRIGQRIARIAGTQSLGQACILLRTGTTNRGDVFLRNQNGGNWALRGAAGGTTYLGQDTTVVANGSGAYRLELEYTSDGTTHTIRLLVFYPANTGGIPDQVFTGTVAGPIDNVRVLNPTGSTGLTMDHGTLWFEDTGAPIWEDTTNDASGAMTFPGATVAGTGVFAAAPTLHYNLAGAATADGFTVTARTTAATSCRLKVSTTSDLATAPVYSPAAAPDADGYVDLVVTGLAPSTRYFWGVEVDGVLDAAMNGQAWTLAAAGVPASFTFASSSCHDWTGSDVFANALARLQAIGARFFVQLGDLGYPYTTAAGTPVAPSNRAQLRADRLLQFETPAVMAFYRAFALSHTYSDCDGAGANSDGTWPAFLSGDVQAAYRQMLPLPPMPLPDSQARAWVVGRVRFIHTDELTMSSARGATDNAAKTKLGIAQKAWFKAQLDAAKAARQAVVWFGDGPWVGAPSVGGTLQEWRAYNTERVEIGNYIAAAGMSKQVLRIHGDTHALAADDGTNNPYGGFAFISAAPFSTTAQVWGSPTTNGRWPAVSGPGRQHGEYTVTDTGNTLTVTFSGRAWDTDTTAYVERVTMTVDLTPPPSAAGIAAMTLPSAQIAAGGHVDAPVVTGTGVIVMGALRATGQGASVPPSHDVAGIGELSAPALAAHGVGRAAPPAIVGVIAAVFGPLLIASIGATAVPRVPALDARQREPDSGGRALDAEGGDVSLCSDSNWE